jgi:DNA-binding NarL/FixJ family response regulator
MTMMELLLVEDNQNLRLALKAGLTDTGAMRVVSACDNGEGALEYCLQSPPEVILMDVQLAGEMNGIEAAVAIRREYPRLPVVFYSIQDDDDYYRHFRRSGILSHYAYVRKSNYLLPQMIVPLLQDAVAGRSFIDPAIESRVQEVRYKDEYSPLAVLEPNEQVVAKMLMQGLTNEQIAAQLGFRDKRTVQPGQWTDLRGLGPQRDRYRRKGGPHPGCYHYARGLPHLLECRGNSPRIK